jgi:hypothetical protein
VRKEVPKHRSYVMLARVLQATAAAKGNSNGKWLSAASLDRYLSDINQPPVFGTQYKKDQESKGGRWIRILARCCWIQSERCSYKAAF